MLFLALFMPQNHQLKYLYLLLLTEEQRNKIQAAGIHIRLLMDTPHHPVIKVTAVIINTSMNSETFLIAEEKNEALQSSAATVPDVVLPPSFCPLALWVVVVPYLLTTHFSSVPQSGFPLLYIDALI